MTSTFFQQKQTEHKRKEQLALKNSSNELSELQPHHVLAEQEHSTSKDTPAPYPPQLCNGSLPFHYLAFNKAKCFNASELLVPIWQCHVF